MPFLLIAVGVLAGGFMLATFQQVPFVGCFASSVFYNEIRVFNIPTRDPLCISAQLYYVGMVGGFAVAALGVILAIVSSHSSAQPPTPPAREDDSRPSLAAADIDSQPTAQRVAPLPTPEPASATMPTLQRLVKMEVIRRERSQPETT